MSSKVECLFGFHKWSLFFAMPSSHIAFSGECKFTVSRMCLICGHEDIDREVYTYTSKEAIQIIERIIYINREE